LLWAVAVLLLVVVVVVVEEEEEEDDVAVVALVPTLSSPKLSLLLDSSRPADERSPR
jgi:hypothetical protein